MNFVQQLMRAPVIAEASVESYNRNKVKPAHKGSEGRYRLCLEGQKKTITEVAEFMGYTYHGCRASLLRMVARGQVKVVGKSKKTSNGRVPDLYTWVKGA